MSVISSSQERFRKSLVATLKAILHIVTARLIAMSLLSRFQNGDHMPTSVSPPRQGHSGGLVACGVRANDNGAALVEADVGHVPISTTIQLFDLILLHLIHLPPAFAQGPHPTRKGSKAISARPASRSALISTSPVLHSVSAPIHRSGPACGTLSSSNLYHWPVLFLIHAT